MKKIYVMIVFVLAYGFSAYAHYAENYPITVTQPDGTVVECFTTGDEFYRWVHDENGFTFIQDPQTGVVVYAKLENDELVSTGHRVGSIDPATIGLTPWQIISAEKRMQLRTEFLNNIPEKPVKEGYQARPRSGKNNGTLNNLVIYIRFADESEFPPVGNTHNGFFNEDEPGKSSMFAYFKDLSNGKTLIPSTFYPEGCFDDIIVSYQDIYPRSYFQPYHATANPDGYKGGDNGNERTQREHQLLKRTVEAVENDIPEDLDLDFNGDGLVDNICFVVRGKPDGWASLLWPHRWALYTEDVRIHGKRVWDFNFLLENGLGASVLSHEMFHTLGAPDLYRYSNNTIDPVGRWDLMCANANPPQSTTAWMKYKYGGWIDEIPEIPENGEFTLNNVWSETNNAYKILSPNSTTEFFIVEYRDRSVYWDSGLPGSGLLIYRINTKAGGNADGPPDELYIFRPGGMNNTTPGNINSAHFSEDVGRTVFNNFSNPPCFLSNNNPGSIAIFNIGGTRGETMTFSVDFDMATAQLFVTTNELIFADIPIGTTSQPQTFFAYGNHLGYPITYEVSDNDSNVFTVTESGWKDDGGLLSVTFTPDANKIYIAKITINSLGAVPKTVTLKGSGSTVAIGEQDATSKIAIYPNPTEGEIQVTSYELQVTSVEIFDVMGRMVTPLNPPEGGRLPSFGGVGGGNISHLPNGIYFVRIQTDEGVVVRKVVKR
ncbi:MAG: M6 family metalloprotease domain-containing protein [Bacteroidales bacterium]|nr:M6 family metalloprotease domain-containing protein [Bacteroidales bacterium]